MSGDEVLKEISKRIEKAFEKKAIIGRYGGDEFAVFVYPCTREELNAYLYKLWEFTQQPVKIKNTNYVQTISFGGYIIKKDEGCSLFQSYNYADIALYEVKKNGKNSFLVL